MGNLDPGFLKKVTTPPLVTRKKLQQFGILKTHGGHVTTKSYLSISRDIGITKSDHKHLPLDYEIEN